MQLHPSGYIFLVIVTLVLPILAWTSKRRFDEGFTFPRLPFYVEALFLQGALLFLSLYVVERHQLFLRFHASAGARAWIEAALLFVAAMILMFVSLRLSGASTKERLRRILPQTGRERLLWIAVSLAAAVAEEVTYRGVLATIALRFTEEWWIATVITSAAFGLAHLVQGWKSAMIVAIFGAAFQWITWRSGSLLPAIVVHFLYDAIAGFAIPRSLGAPDFEAGVPSDVDDA